MEFGSEISHQDMTKWLKYTDRPTIHPQYQESSPSKNALVLIKLSAGYVSQRMKMVRLGIIYDDLFLR